MRSASATLARAIVLALFLLGFIASGSAYAHHHEASEAPLDECVQCVQASTVATTPTTTTVAIQPRTTEVVAVPAAIEVAEGCRHEPRGRAPPLHAPAF